VRGVRKIGVVRKTKGKNRGWERENAENGRPKHFGGRTMGKGSWRIPTAGGRLMREKG